MYGICRWLLNNCKLRLLKMAVYKIDFKLIRIGVFPHPYISEKGPRDFWNKYVFHMNFQNKNENREKKALFVNI